ncbi:Nudix hydrolase 22 [Hibiscus syriacus]|uniref:Nudix hydrolase 22 n=1 Tax=Hibiscus syriacus TaxID=106335 RepID=A0A6A2YHJ5_HIBSY|nr:Nudix hydrolase 22 [Hibiscus syriacus]
MASSTSFLNGGSSSFPSQRLLALAQQLRHYKAPPSSLDDNVEQMIQEAAGEVVQKPEKFRPKKAAVLICLFEGDDGDLRVILTKRAAKEEIGLDPSLVKVVAVLESFLSKPKPNPTEVDAVFDAPLEMFIKDENRNAEEREMMGEKYLLHFFDYETEDKKYLIWGLTARILIRAASVVYQLPPAFLEAGTESQVRIS